MIDRLIYFLKKIFGFNSTKCLPAVELAGNDLSVPNGNNFNLAVIKNDIKNDMNNTDIKFEESKGKEQELGEDLSNSDLVSAALGKEETHREDVTEIEFEYDENKVQEMNKKIDYYKKNTDELYLLTLAEILEINFYYKKRLEKLENSNN